MLYCFWTFKFSHKRREKALAARLKATQNGIRWIGVSYQISRPSPLQNLLSSRQQVDSNKDSSLWCTASQANARALGREKKANVVAALSSWTLGGHPVYLCNCTLTNCIVPNILSFFAPEDIKQNVWYDTFCAFRRERIVCDRDIDYLATWAAHAKMAND